MTGHASSWVRRCTVTDMTAYTTAAVHRRKPLSALVSSQGCHESSLLNRSYLAEVAKARRKGLSPNTSKLGRAGGPVEEGRGEGEVPQAAMGVHPCAASERTGAAVGLGGGDTTRSCTACPSSIAVWSNTAGSQVSTGHISAEGWSALLGPDAGLMVMEAGQGGTRGRDPSRHALH